MYLTFVKLSINDVDVLFYKNNFMSNVNSICHSGTVVIDENPSEVELYTCTESRTFACLPIIYFHNESNTFRYMCDDSLFTIKNGEPDRAPE